MDDMDIVYKQEVVRQPLVNSGFLGGSRSTNSLCCNCTSRGPWQLRKWITTNVVTDTIFIKSQDQHKKNENLYRYTDRQMHNVYWRC